MAACSFVQGPRGRCDRYRHFAASPPRETCAVFSATLQRLTTPRRTTS